MTDNISSDGFPEGAAAKIEEAVELITRGDESPYDRIGQRLIDAFHTGYGVQPPDEPYAWAVAAVWKARCKLEAIAKELCLNGGAEEWFELAKSVIALLDAALADWGMRTPPGWPLATLRYIPAVRRPPLLH